MKNSHRWFCALFFVSSLVVVGWVIAKQTKRLNSIHVPANSERVVVRSETPVADLQALTTAQPAAKYRAVAVPALAAIAQATPPPTTPLLSAQVAEKLNEELHEKPRYDEPDEAIEYYRLKRLPPGEQEIPVEKYLVAKTQMEAMPQYSTAQHRVLPSRRELKASRTEAATEVMGEALGTWTPLGPGNIGGRTRALLIHPTTPNVMYAAGVAGGVWKTTNSGAAWQPLTDMMANIAVSCLAFDPGNPNVIYAGTGEGVFNGDAVRGAGIFRTTDSGTNWTQLANTGTSDFYYINDLVVSQANPQHLYAGTRTGVWRSLDGGATWSKALNYTDGCLDLVMRTDQATDYVFAACGTFGGGEIFRNTDAGGAGTWTSVQKETGMGRTSLALAPSNQNVIYALSASTLTGTFRDGLFALFRSTSSGDSGTWAAQVRNNNPLKLNTILLTNPLSAFRSECGLGANSFGNQGWYDNVIAVDPLDANRVWVGGVDVFRSDDGGANWGLASYWWPEPNVPQYAHADQHTIVFHPNYNGTTNKQMFIGNDGGIFRTDDARATVVAGVTAPCNPAASGMRWTALNNNYGVTQFYHGAVFPDGKSYFGGAQDNGTLLGTDASGVNGWREIWGGDGGYVAIDPTNPQVLYASTQRGGFRKSTDGGATFSSARLGISDTTLFIAPLAMDPSDPQRLWTGGAKLWRTENGGANWREVVGSQYSFSAIAISPHDSNKVLAGGNTGALRTVLMVNDVATITEQSPRSGFVSSVAFDPTDRQIAYATYSTFGGNHVWKSTVGGAAWTSIDGTGPNRLPDLPVHCLVVDPTNPLRLFVGTDLGVFVTTDGGSNWAVENTGFANTPVEWLVINTANNVTSLYAFTHGRGVARINIGGSVCTYSLSTPRQSFSVAGGSNSVDVVGSSGCTWTATSNVDWIVLTGISSGNGNGTVSYYVAPNTYLGNRNGTVTIAGKSIVIMQSGNRDADAPVVKILSHPVVSPYKTGARTIILYGTATDNVGVTSVSWRNERGFGGTLSLDKESWSAYGVTLESGVNRFTVTARDAAGNEGRATATIVSVPEFTIQTLAGIIDFHGYSGDGGLGTSARLGGAIDVAIDGEGNIYIAEYASHRIRKWNAATGIISTVAGVGQYAMSGGFSGDGGAATDAQLNGPNGVTVDSIGNLYIADTVNHRIRKVATTGIISTIAGTGESGYGGDDGPAIAAQLNGPSRLVIDDQGNLYFSDSNNYRVRKISRQTGVITTVAGTGVTGFSGDGGTATAAQLKYPVGLALNNGNLYIADRADNRVRKVSLASGLITTVAGTGDFFIGNEGGFAVNTGIGPPGGVAFDREGNLYISRTYDSGVVWKVNREGIITMVVAVSGNRNDEGFPSTQARSVFPNGIAIDKNDNVVFADTGSARVRRLNRTSDTVPPVIAITTPTSSSTYTTTQGTIALSGTASDSSSITHVTLSNDRGGEGIAVGKENWSINNIPLKFGSNSFVVTAWDSHGNSSRASLTVISNLPSAFATIAGTRVTGFNLESGSGLASQLYAPETVAIDSAGNLYIADKGNHRIRKVTRSGLISTVAGNGQLGSSGDGGPAINAAMNEPNAVVVDSAGNLYISDTNNHRIRKVNTAGVITTMAGAGLPGFGGDGGAGTQALLNTPVGLALDTAGNLLIADGGNHRVRKLNLGTGIITTIVGNGYGFGGDGGQAGQAQLNFPTGVALDQSGDLYIAETSNHQVRKVTPAGIISRYAGAGTRGFSGDGGPATAAQFNGPGGIAVDAAGNLYVTDQGNNRVRKIAPDGTITTVAGTGNTQSITDEGGTALNAALNAPAGVAVDGAGNLFIADTGNHRVVVAAAYKSAATVNGASFATQQPVAPEAIVSVFGANLATRDQGVTQLPLPTELAGTSVKVRDSLSVERLAPLFYVGKLQVNYQIPAGTAAGFATVTITNANGEIFTSAVNVTGVTPGIFTANQNGSGAASASVLYVTGANRRSDTVAVCDANGQNCVPRQIDVNAASEVYLELYGTGLRNHSGLANVSVTVGGVAVPVLYAGSQPQFVGLDQINIQLPRSLAGRGDVDVILTVDSKAANPVKINLK